MPVNAKTTKKQVKIRLARHRSSGYQVISVVNSLTPVVGSFLKEKEVQVFIDDANTTVLVSR